ncbi:uncharacterized protein LOC122294927 isoform X2 [Carya illinoinensis]|uniref:uncharacterized protein LOC122294927 isoform X2 n=1 Tax=Carya illinoinensis TaxID=32201 RepID=UPI001C71B91E|nr:uncharacterized protein LOC122294927 isoform X2 [Carya illinoinensis]XP_042959852.1 uncharacterized protein LOC122294927 isoform X2 [Carya illinoinensis]XP_042959853.1 uncharacterized protein LOC122294927 isoform X2 [Carya illinoinensis]XP_042959854.1 uncharacterized protein LOC122294927 isoform X2 [Carya illinoinensis]XP_042959855.1 uncharacterized protein LOC122294927 isoform X2 [Carya illinoinensis]
MPSESDKWGWKHVSVFGGFDKGTGTKRWKCNHCNLRYNGSYSRVRAHLLGFAGVGVKSCPAIDRSLREAFQIMEEERLARKKEKTSGTPGKRIRTSRPSLSSVTKEDVDDIVARFFYADGFNIKVVNSPYFLEMAKAIAAFGPGYEPPTRDELCDSYLSKEKGRIEKSLALVRESWPHTGCTMLCVSRSDSSLGCLHIDIYVCSPRGLAFLKAVDIDANDDNVFPGALTDAIIEVGPTNVVQIISHLGPACKSSESLILSKFPHIFWSPCASHSICMLMEEIAELEWVKSVVVCAKETEQCIMAYQRSSSVILIQNLEGSSDLLSTKFVPSYGIVQRIFQLKQTLQEIVAGEDWKQWKLCIPEDIASIEAAISSDDFWSRANLFLQLCEPFLSFLATLNTDRSVMGDLYDCQVQALEAVRSQRIDSVSNVLEELIENRWDVLFSPLHAAGYILNPKYFGKGQTRDRTVMRGWKATLERYEREATARRVLREQLSSYWRLEGSLGEEDAVDCRDKMDPVAWWENFGFETPHLQTLAVKVLSQVSSVGMCEEIWQDNDFPCRRTANRLEVERVEDLVFVRNNLRLHSQRNGISRSPSFQRNQIPSSPSGIKTWDGTRLDQIKTIFSIHDTS